MTKEHRAIRRIFVGYAITLGALTAAGVLAGRTVGVRTEQWASVTHTFTAIQRIDALRGAAEDAQRTAPNEAPAGASPPRSTRFARPSPTIRSSPAASIR